MIKYRVAQDVKEQLSKSGCRILGVILNQTQRKKRGVKGQSAYYSHYGEYYSSESQTKRVAPPATTMAKGAVPPPPPKRQS